MSQERKIFQSIQQSNVAKSAIDLSHDKLTTFDMGELIPCLTQEVLPGDSFSVNSEVLVRMAPLIGPMMHRVNVYMHYFFVPNRIIWPDWEEFITGGPDGNSTVQMPTFNPSNVKAGELWDYLGLPINQSLMEQTNLRPSALPFWGYQSIWNEYYRDQNLQDPIDIPNGGTERWQLRYRAWEKDYFTSALPFAQRGPAVTLPITWSPTYQTFSLGRNVPNTDTDPSGALTLVPAGANDGISEIQDPSGNKIQIQNLTVDQENTSLTINDLREANRLQQWLETSARSGSRYVETILAHFGEQSSDARMQRPEYLGGGRQPVVISEVLSTVDVADGAPQGTQSGHAISVGSDMAFQHSFEEHGYIHGILSVLPRTSYSSGIPKHFMRKDRFDYYWPEFANLGEQEIKNYEVFLDQTAAGDSWNENTWGYQQRYGEYKYQENTYHGDFRKSGYNTWHMGRIFTARTLLNGAFIECIPTKRVFAVQATDTDSLQAQIYHDIQANRPMPYFAQPQL